MKPDDLKEIFTKYGNFQKPNTNPLIKSSAAGLANYEGEKWARHRKIINPAFHLEKLKVFFSSCTHSWNKYNILYKSKLNDKPILVLMCLCYKLSMVLF